MSLLTQPEEIKIPSAFQGLVYGAPGVGKTTLALSAPKPVIIDLDKGIHRVEKEFRCPTLQTKNYQEILNLLKSNEIDPYDTIIIDTIGKLVESIGDWLAIDNPKYKQSDGTLTQKAWGAIKEQFKVFYKILEDKNKNLVFVAHEREAKDGDERYMRPDISGSSGAELVKEIDFMGYIEIRGAQRTISFTPSDKFHAKGGLGLNSYIQIPNALKEGNLFLTNVVVEKIKERNKADEEFNKKYYEIIDAGLKEIEKVAASEDLSTAFEKISKLEALGDSKYVLWNNLQQKAKEIGFIWVNGEWKENEDPLA